MPLDIKGFVTPEQDLSELQKLGTEFAAQKKAQAKADEEQKAGQNTMLTMLTSMTDPKDYLSGAPTDPQVVKGFSDIYQKGLNLITGTKGINNNMLAMALSPDIAKLAQYGTTAKVIKKGLDEGIAKFTEDSGYDKNALYDLAKKDIFFNEDGTPRDLNNIDVTTDPFAKVIDKHPELVTTSRGLDTWLKGQEKSTLTHDVTMGTRPGTVKKRKIEVSAPAWAMPEVDTKGKFTEKIIPKFETLKDGEEQVFHNGEPIRLLPADTYRSIMEQSPSVANYIKGQVLKHAREYQNATGEPINQQSDKFNLLGRAILHDELKNRSAGTFKTLESQVASTRAEPKGGISIGYDPTGGGKTSGIVWDEIQDLDVLSKDRKNKKAVIRNGSITNADGTPYNGKLDIDISNLPSDMIPVMKSAGIELEGETGQSYQFEIKDGIIDAMQTPKGRVTRNDIRRAQEVRDKERPGQQMTYGSQTSKQDIETTKGRYQRAKDAALKGLGKIKAAITPKSNKIKGTDQSLY
jgi:hypothetical protein